MRVVMQGLPANGAGLLRIVSCCSQLGRWDEAYAAWTVMQAAGMQPDGACLNALLAALQAAKQWQHVVQVFQAAQQTQVANFDHRGLLQTALRAVAHTVLYHGLLYVMLTTADMIILDCMTFQKITFRV